MNELNVEIRQTAGKIECNFDELKESLAMQMSAYEDMVVSEDGIKSAKTELATLRKIRKAVDDKRKEIKRDFIAPYEEFEEKVKELLEEIDKPITLIDTQLKMFEEERIIEKQKRCKEIYDEQIGEFEKFLPYEKVYRPQWNNATFSESDVKYDISEAITKITSDLAVIKNLNSEIYDTLIDTYIRYGNDLSKAVERNSQYIADKQRLEEQAKKEAEKIKEQAIKPIDPASPLGTLDALVKATKTVTFIVSAEDEKQVEEMLSFAQITFRKGE